MDIGWLYDLTISLYTALKTPRNPGFLGTEKLKATATPPYSYNRFANTKARAHLQPIREESVDRDQELRDRFHHELESRDEDAKDAADNDYQMDIEDHLPPDWDGDEETTLINWLQHEYVVLFLHLLLII